MARQRPGGTLPGWPATGMIALIAAVLAAPLATLFPGYATLRERAFDGLLDHTRPTLPQDRITVVDIDRAALARIGPWPWSRDKLATLVAAVARAKPSVIALDVLIAGDDDKSPAALARRLAALTGDDVLRDKSRTMPDGDPLLAAALDAVPVILGLGLDPETAGPRLPTTLVLIRGKPELPALWQAPGAIGPPLALAAAGSGLGVLALPADGDGRVRRVPLIAATPPHLLPGLATEAARTALGAGSMLVSAEPRALRIGDRTLPLGPDAMLRLRPPASEMWAARVVPALDVLDTGPATARLAGRIVFIGSSAPELGGLRVSAEGRLGPSVQMHADATAQILAGDVPLRSSLTATFETVAAWLAAMAAVLLGMRRAPLYGALATAAIAVTWLLLSRGVAAGDGTLLDPILVPLVAGLGFAVSALTTSARARKREAALRARFSQHLSPAVVARIAAEPDLLKLEGETREVTALFTDIEGFTAMVERSDAKAIVGLLDRYFEGAIDIVVKHGGMVDKLVGDAIHALFNAPLDLDGHPRHAIACAQELLAFTETFRADPTADAHGFGRTRIGIETGRAVVGDVGSGHKLDYTAHGDAINTAARLEAANKELGSSICVGPGAAAQAAPGTLRPLALLYVRGRSEKVAVWEPWPREYAERDRAAYLAASDLAAKDPRAAADAFAALAAKLPSDAVLPRTAARLRVS